MHFVKPFDAWGQGAAAHLPSAPQDEKICIKASSCVHVFRETWPCPLARPGGRPHPAGPRRSPRCCTPRQSCAPSFAPPPPRAPARPAPPAWSTPGKQAWCGSGRRSKLGAAGKVARGNGAALKQCTMQASPWPNGMPAAALLTLLRSSRPAGFTTSSSGSAGEAGILYQPSSTAAARACICRKLSCSPSAAKLEASCRHANRGVAAAQQRHCNGTGCCCSLCGMG